MLIVIDDNPDRGRYISSFLRKYGIYSTFQSYYEARDGLKAFTEGKTIKRMDRRKKSYVPPMIMLAVLPEDANILMTILRYIVMIPNTVLMVMPGNCDNDIIKICEMYCDYTYSIKEFEHNPIALTEKIYDIILGEFGILRENVHVNRLTVELSGHAYISGKELNLTQTQFEIVRFIAINHPRKYTGAEIMEYCFGNYLHQGFGVIATHMTHINEKSIEVAGYRIIENSFGEGYFISEI